MSIRTDRKKNCIRCGKNFLCPYGIGKKVWEKRKYCSHKCGNPLLSATREKKCLTCRKKFYCPKSQSISWWNDRKYCSRKCVPYGGYSRGHIPWNKGIKWKRMEGKNSPVWKGNNIKYMTLHDWMRDKYGKPKKCEFCGKTKGKIHYASIDHRYTRNIKDWLRLCPNCHNKYDREHKNLNYASI